MKRRFVGLLISVLLLFVCAVAAAEIVTGSGYMSNMAGSYGSKNITWTLNTETGEMTIQGSGSWGTYDGTVSYRPWDASAGSPYYGVGKYLGMIKKVVIQEGITNVAGNAFGGATNLVSVTLPESIQVIDDYAFNGCTALTSVTIPSKVTKIGKCAFRGCTVLAQANIPAGVTSIGEEAFKDTALKSIETYGSIGKNAFRGSMLTSVVIHQCSDLGEGGAFYECKKLSSVVFQDCSMTEIPQYSFSYCPIMSVSIPQTVTSIGEYAFGSTSLTGITLPEKLNSLGDSAFEKSKLTAVTVPNNVQMMAEECFKECTNLISATMPSGISLLPERTFSGCTALTTVTIPKGILILGAESFQYCSSLRTVALPDGFMSFQDGVFYSCRNLEQISLPVSLSTVSRNAFYDCSNLSKVDYAGSVAQWESLSIADGNDALKTAFYNPTAITLNQQEGSVQVGNSLRLTATLTPAHAVTELTWTSSKADVAAVDDEGVVTGVKKGTATITVTTANGLKASCKVEVTVPEPKKIKLNKTGTVTLKKGKTLKLKVTLKPEGSVTTLKWKSSNSKVAKVSSKGVVKALKKGKATITVTTPNGLKAKVKIVVK